MKSKELKKMSRRELLEMLLAQSQKIDRQQAKIDELTAELEKKQMTIKNAGSIAEASLQLSGIFEAAQKAVDIYVSNIKEKDPLKDTKGLK